MFSTTIRRTTATVLTGVAIAVAGGTPAASAMPADHVNGPAPAPAVDLRSPDARDTVRVDLRSPDTRDAVSGIRPADVAPAPGRADLDDGAFDWSTAGIAAAVLVGTLIAAAAGVGVLRQRHGRMVA